MKNIRKIKFTRIIAMLLVMIMLVSSLPVTVLAEELDGIITTEETTTLTEETTTLTEDTTTSTKESTPPIMQITPNANLSANAEGEGNTAQIFSFGSEGGTLPVNSALTSEEYISISGSGTLVVQFNDTFKELKVTGDVNVGALTIRGEGTVTIGGNLIIDGNLDSATADVTVTGNTTIGGNVTIEGGTWTCSTVEVSGDSISVTDATVNNATFFGFVDSAEGDKTLTVSGATFNSVGTVGVNANNTNVVMAVSGTYTLANSNLIHDYPITYYGTDGVEIEPQITWDVAYRVKDNGTEKKFIVSGEEKDTFPLPTAEDVVGYTFGGWKKNATDTSAISELVLNDIGVVNKLYVELTPHDVTVNWELGYTPDQYTNDSTDPAFPCTPVIQQANTTLTLPEPFRFGYDFVGWQVMLGDTSEGEPVRDEIKIEPHLLTHDEDDKAILTLKAIWKVHEFPLKLQITLPTGYTIDKIQFKADGNEDWLSISAFVDKYKGALGDNNDMQFADAEYGITLGQYMDEILPGLYIRTDDGKWTVSGWSLHLVNYDDESKIAMGEHALFGTSAPENYTLRKYQEELSATLLSTLASVWTEDINDIVFNNTDWQGIWEIWINKRDQYGDWSGYNQYSPTENKLMDIPYGSKIQFRVAVNSNDATKASFGLWTLTAGGNAVSAKETAYTSGDAYLCYESTMPATDLTASFTALESISVNLKKSPVTDAEITINGITRAGFWTNEQISSYWPIYDANDTYGYGYVLASENISQGVGYSNNVPQNLRYFYEWPKNGDMYVTTGDANTSYEGAGNGTQNGTQNQYRAIKYIGSNRKIYLVDCHLWATDAYSNMTDTATASIMPQACNIFYTINGEEDKNGYIYTYFVGDNNIIAAMGQEQKSSWMSLHTAKTNGMSKVQLGSLLGASYQKLHDLDITAYAHPTYKDNFKHLTYFLGTYVRASKCKIDLPQKSMRQCEYTDCTVNVGQYIGGGTPLGLLGNSIMVVNEITFSYQLKVTGNSSLIVKKTVKDGYKDYKSVSKIDTTGLVLIMSDRFSTPHLEIAKGTVLANTISTNALYVQGGTVVVNNMRNMVAMGNTVASNGDGDFLPAYNIFADYNQNTTGMNKVAWRFSGGDVYLMGYKGTDFSESPLNALVGEHTFGNIETLAQEIQAVLAGCTDEAIKNIYQESKANYSQNECIMFGNSSIQYTDTNGQSFLFDGANIYCAGRMTLFNTTNITGGTIETPVLSCKQDMTITGGTINAGEVGNSASVLIGSEGLKHYAKTTITGGTINGITRIGAVSKPTYQTVENHSYVEIIENADITTAGDANIQIDRHIYINYPAKVARESYYNSLPATHNTNDSKANYTFTIPDEAPVYINMYVIGNPNSFESLDWTSGSGSFAAPTEIASPDLIYSWTIEDGQPKVTGGYANELLSGEDLTEEEKALVGKDHITLYPYIVIPRELKVYQDSSIVTLIAINDESQKDTLKVGYDSITGVPANHTLKFTLNKNMADKVVLWYKDENGVYHNLMEEGMVSSDGLTVTFAMPNLDNVELYICDEMPLYFNKMDIQINNDGFNVEIDPTREDAKFKYLGGLYISRDDGQSDYIDNKIVISEDYVKADSRPITLNKFYCAMDIRKNADVLFYLDGKQYNKSHTMIGYNAAAIEFVGKNDNHTDGWDEIAYLDLGGTKKVTFRNLTFSMTTLTITGGKVNTLEVIDCNVPQWGDNLNYGADVPNVYIENSHIFVCNENGIQRANASCTMTIKNSTVTSSSNNIFSCNGWTAAGGNVILDNTRVNCPGDPYYQPITGTDRENDIVLLTSLTMINGSIFYNPTSFRISKSLTIDENSELYVGFDSENHSNGRVLTPTITVKDGGRLDAKYVVCAGYGTTESVTKPNTDGILVNGGSINAYFVGGDNGAVINMVDGEISTTYLGTIGKYIYNDDVVNADDIEFTVYSMVCNSTVNINGGTVNILDGGHLGGGTSTVNITGGFVSAENGSITGDTITISGKDTKMKVAYIIAEDGKVTITEVNAEHFDNAYTYNDRKNDKVAIFITKELKAHEIYIDDGAIIYATSVYSYVLPGEESAQFTVVPDSGAELYTQNYGYLGGGEHILIFIQTDGDGNQNIWGTIAISILYDFGDMYGEDADLIGEIIGSSGEVNPDYYIYQAGGTLELNKLSHPYLKFMGWKTENVQDSFVNTINTGLIPNGSVVKRIAVWEPKPIQFKVIMDGSIFGTDEDIANEVDLTVGALDNGVFTWNSIIDAAYLDILWGSETTSENKFVYDDHMLHTHSITSLQVYTAGGSKLIGDKVTHAMINAYEDGANGPLIIRIASVSKTALNLTFHLNIKDGKPATAKFVAQSLADKTAYKITPNMGVYFNDAPGAGLVDSLDDLSAVGYYFLGWSSVPNADPDNFAESKFDPTGKVGTDITAKEWYAVWKPKEYYVRFYASPISPAGGKYHLVKDGSTTIPTDEGTTTSDLATAPYSDLVLVYDEIIDAEGHIVPTVWREGWVFRSWYYVDKVNGEEKPVEFDDTEFFSVSDKEHHFNFEDFANTGSEGAPALIFYAKYDPLTITYDTNGGSFVKDDTNQQEYADAGTALRGYISVSGNLSTDWEYVSGADDSAYRAISTTGEYYNTNKTYVEGDYRYTVGRNGYTFKGWYTDSACTQPIEVTPKFSLTHITVYAKWTANRYNVTLNAADDSYTSGAEFVVKSGDSYVLHDDDTRTQTVQLTVGEIINVGPDRNEWGTRGGDTDVTPRPLWGFVFAPMDPRVTGDEEYAKYIKKIEELYKSGDLYVKGTSRFALPEEDSDSEPIPDYPDGANIQMYATYHNYAIVFMQYYLNKDGEVTQRVIETVQKGAIDAYNLQKLKEIEVNLPGEGYTPLGWYVNSTTIDNDRAYDDVKKFLENFNAYQTEAENILKTYDIIVYHIYAADEVINDKKFVSDPVAQVKPSEVNVIRIQEFTVPQNMQPGILLYSFKNEVYSEKYAETNPETGAVTRDYTVEPYNGSLTFADSLEAYNFNGANDTVYFTLSVIRGGMEVGSYILEAVNIVNTNIAVQPNDKLVLTLYHSYVITEESNSSFDLSFTFNDSTGKNIPGQQLLLDNVNLSLKESQYTVVYHAGSEGKIVKDAGDFDLANDIDTLEISGNALEVFGYIEKMPTFVGYHHATELDEDQRWYQETSSSTVIVKGSEIIVNVPDSLVYDENGKLHLYARWNPNIHDFIAKPDVLNEWTVEYDDDDDGIWVSLTDSTAKELPYGTKIRFSPKLNITSRPEYVKLDINDNEPMRLKFDIELGLDGYYSWYMPDADVTALYSDILDLFLDNGDIILLPNSFYQNKANQTNIWHDWSGGYLIRQNALDDTSVATDNTLTVNGDMDGEIIMLGKLNISGEDSISLDQFSDEYLEEGYQSEVGKNVTLTLTEDEVEAANILVPKSSTLTVVGKTESEKLTLIPKDGASAIGQSSGAYNSKITVQNCAVTVNETGEYVGTWFGGSATDSVTLINVILNQSEPDNGIAGRYVTYADTVTITNCNIGTDTQRISEPIYAEKTLTINGGTLYMQPIVPQNEVSMIGTTAEGTVEIDNEAFVNIKYYGTYRSNKPFTGTLMLNDQKAFVVIDNMLVLDTQYGNIEISGTQFTQGSETKNHSGNYLVLQEFDDTAINVTVNADKTLTLVQPKSYDFNLGTFDVNGNTKVYSQTNAAGTALTVNIADVNIFTGKTLTATLTENDTVKLADEAFGASEGTYEQSKGKLTATTNVEGNPDPVLADIEGRNMDIVLEDVIVTATSLIAKNLTLADCTVTCTGGDGFVGSYGVEDSDNDGVADGITTVTLSGTTKIDATTVGALGEKNKTFTKVDVNGSQVYVTGTLIRDIYRITYQKQAAYELADGTKTVLRTEQDYTAGGNVTDPNVTVPVAKPTTTGTNKFVTWYIINTNDEKISIFLRENVLDKYEEKFTGGFQNGLSFGDAVYAENDANGIPTITVYAFYTISGTVVLETNYHFFAGEFGDKNSITTASDRGWSALFTIESTRENGEDYAVTFSEKQPEGTKLILVWLAKPNDKPMYYYYEVSDLTEKTIPFSQFEELGTSVKLNLGASDKESESFIITVDYTYAIEIPESKTYTVGFGYQAVDQSTVDELCAATVSVLKADETAELTVTAETVDLTKMPNNELYNDKYYGILVEADHDFRYDIKPKLGNIVGTLIGGNMILFNLGEYKQESQSTEFTVSGLPEGYEYNWSVVFLEDSEQVNTWKRLS